MSTHKICSNGKIRSLDGKISLDLWSLPTCFGSNIKTMNIVVSGGRYI